jgi:hypothetical protein
MTLIGHIKCTCMPWDSTLLHYETSGLRKRLAQNLMHFLNILSQKKKSLLSSSSNMIEWIQLWPLQVGWVNYDTEIAASSHLVSLRKLIVFSKHHSTNFLDKSLAYVQFYSRKYIRVIVSLLKDSHEGIRQILVSEYML